MTSASRSQAILPRFAASDEAHDKIANWTARLKSGPDTKLRYRPAQLPYSLCSYQSEWGEKRPQAGHAVTFH
jgi:hypothetical protein